ncbi:MAG: hypothetical protein AMXMBFR7_23470 [Planctomycetota bacterium]
MKDKIKSNAEFVIENLRPICPIRFGYTAESVHWLEGYIERLRESGELDEPGAKDALTNTFGSYLGECIIHCYGGSWTNGEDGWCVAFENGNIAFPFAKVSKQLENGLDDGVHSFFRAIPAILKVDLKRPEVLEQHADADQIPEPDGKVLNGSFSTSAPNVRPSYLRYLWYHPDLLILLKCFLICTPLAAGIIYLGVWMSTSTLTGLPKIGWLCWALGGVVGLIGFGALGFLFWLLPRLADIYENALLTPGVIASTEPFYLLVLANMNTGLGPDCWGLKRWPVSALPCHEHRIGARVPCVAGFQEGEHLERWGDFSPVPIAYGTGDVATIEELTKKIGAESFDRLELCIRKGVVPEKDGELLFLDKDLQVIEKVDTNPPVEEDPKPEQGNSEERTG